MATGRLATASATGRGLCGVGRSGDGGGQDGEGDGSEAAQNSFDQVPLIAALKKS